MTSLPGQPWTDESGFSAGLGGFSNPQQVNPLGASEAPASQLQIEILTIRVICLENIVRDIVGTLAPFMAPEEVAAFLDRLAPEKVLTGGDKSSITFAPAPGAEDPHGETEETGDKNES